MSRVNDSKRGGVSRRGPSGGNSGHSKRRTEQPTKHVSQSIPSTGRLRTEPFVMPHKIKNVIECQRNTLVTAITLLHCLHSTLRRQRQRADGGPIESFAVEAASKLADFPVVTEMLLENISSVHDALDSTSLCRAMTGPA